MNPTQIAHQLIEAKNSKVLLKPFSQSGEAFDVDFAYKVQFAGLTSHLESGKSLSGYKMGLTSRAKQVDVGVDKPILGYLLKEEELKCSSELRRDQYVQPRIEPEVVMTLKSPLKGSQITYREVLQAIESVVLGIEILDSRFEKFQFALSDVVADNASAAGYLLGGVNVKKHLDKLKLLAVIVRKNGQVVQTGTPAAVLGDPVLSVLTLVQMLSRYDRGLLNGQVVLSGGICASVPFEKGDELEIQWPFESIKIQA